jgi:hypothetical protein
VPSMKQVFRVQGFKHPLRLFRFNHRCRRRRRLMMMSCCRRRRRAATALLIAGALNLLSGVSFSGSAVPSSPLWSVTCSLVTGEATEVNKNNNCKKFVHSLLANVCCCRRFWRRRRAASCPAAGAACGTNPCVLAALAHRPPVSAPLPQDVPTEQLMQIRKQVQEEAQYFNESFQQLRMAQS